MPLFDVKLDDGTTLQLEADKAPSEQEVVDYLHSQQQQEQPKVSALKAGLQHAAAGVGPERPLLVEQSWAEQPVAPSARWERW